MPDHTAPRPASRLIGLVGECQGAGGIIEFVDPASTPDAALSTIATAPSPVQPLRGRR